MTPFSRITGRSLARVRAVSDARRAALSGLIDHAPTFPPASLPAAAALEEDRRARASEHAWLLRRLVWPASQLPALGDEERELSVLLDAPYGGDPRAAAVETRWDAQLQTLVGEAYVELPLGDGIEERVAVLAERGYRAKVRCGGETVPSAAELGRFVRACRNARVPFKATAGLHHPLARDGAHGFLNVLAACVFEDESALEGDVTLDGDALRWGGRAAGAGELERARREQFAAIGSCSFFEPVDDLRELGVL
jgi:hypothetical protein